MKKVIVPVRFNGHVEMLVPDYLDEETAKLLAEKKALALIVATECSDGPEEEAYEEFCSEQNNSNHDPEKMWDDSVWSGVGGTWMIN